MAGLHGSSSVLLSLTSDRTGLSFNWEVVCADERKGSELIISFFMIVCFGTRATYGCEIWFAFSLPDWSFVMFGLVIIIIF